jgi:hypothetical protein
MATLSFSCSHLLSITLIFGFRIEKFLCYLPLIIFPFNPTQRGGTSSPILPSRIWFESLFPYFLNSWSTYFNLLNYVQFWNSKKLGYFQVSVFVESIEFLISSYLPKPLPFIRSNVLQGIFLWELKFLILHPFRCNMFHSHSSQLVILVSVYF